MYVDVKECEGQNRAMGDSFGEISCVRYLAINDTCVCLTRRGEVVYSRLVSGE